MPAIACYQLDNHTPKIIQALIDNNWRFGGNKITMQTEFHKYIYLWDDWSVCHSKNHNDKDRHIHPPLETNVGVFLENIKNGRPYTMCNDKIRFIRPVTKDELQKVCDSMGLLYP